ncbi:type II toxin-antitoxin system death-on-curing family toxin [Lacticaseibacillus porcinae]|uniref:type II toxin-antitoxin system death-on-curing family toxin n=1 Tax=Lacticaseibacillus porcinae TaxID=1123687 RepID=UPI000F7AF8E4|nr:type II toxin-antitoxin system death-on-curing family toxin [Lacticaseibacillus porcinae]
MNEPTEYVKCQGNSDIQYNQFTQAVVQKYAYETHASGNFSVRIEKIGTTADNEHSIIKLFHEDQLVSHYNILFASWVRKLTPEAMADINTQAEKMFREEYFYGVKDCNTLSAILASVQESYFGVDPYEGVVSKAATLWYKIATSQVFHNGNKRTALLSGIIFLDINGFSLNEPNGNELYEITKKVANHQFSAKSLESYILQRLIVKTYNSIDAAKSATGWAIRMKLNIDNPEN